MAANSMGKTTEEFNKLIASGQIMTKDFLPGFLEYVSKSTKASGSYATALEKVGTAQGRMITELQLGVNEGFTAGESGFVKFFKDLGRIILVNQATFEGFGVLFGTVASSISGAIKIIAYPLAFLSNGVKHFGKIINSALDTKKPRSQLTFFQKVIKDLRIVLLYIKLGFNEAEIALFRLSTMFDETNKGVSESTKEWLALASTLVVVAGNIFLIYKAFRLLKGIISSPFEGIRRLLSLIAGMFGVKKLKDVLDGKRSKGDQKGKSTGSGSPYKQVLEDARKERLAASPEGRGGWSGRMGVIGRSLTGASKGLAAFGIGMGSVLSTEEAIKRYTEMNAERKIPNELLMFPKQTITNNVTINVESSDPQGVTREIERKSKELFSNMLTVAPTSSP